jgi:uncharacterized membrane protein
MRITKLLLKILMAIFYVGAGVNHFLKPDFYLKMMPPYLPFHAALNYTSGFFEILLGILLLVPRCTRFAAWSLIALLIAVFPANIYMAMNPDLFPDLKPLALLIRLPFQALFIVWAYWYTRPYKPVREPAAELIKDFP